MSHILGARVTFLPTKLLYVWLLPFGVFVGTSRHFITEQCVGGYDFSGNTCNKAQYQDSRHNIHTLETGLSSEFGIWGPLKIRGKFSKLFLLGKVKMIGPNKKKRGNMGGVGFVSYDKKIFNGIVGGKEKRFIFKKD